MSESKIEWTDFTFNPWWGCTKVSPGCDHCYAETFAKRVGQHVWGKDAPRRQMSDKHWAEPLKWDRAAALAGVRRRVFCASMADVFEGREDQQANRLRLWALIRATPSLDWLLLTKRPKAILPLIMADALALDDSPGFTEEANTATWLSLWMRGHPPGNVWLGTTVEDEERCRTRPADLLRAPAAVHFISAEPLLEHVDLSPWFVSADGFVLRSWNDGPAHVDDGAKGIDWVIVGGESGHGARPFNLGWARDIKAQCKNAGVAFFFKQAGAYVVGETHERIEQFGLPGLDGAPLDGLDANGRWRLKMFDRKGADLSEIPVDLCVREFPKGGDR